MSKIKGPGIFLAQFVGDQAPFNSLVAMAEWAAGLGYKGVQIPTWESSLIDLEKAAESKDYCDELSGMLAGKRDSSILENKVLSTNKSTYSSRISLSKGTSQRCGH